MLGWLLNLGFAGGYEESEVAEAPNYYAIWDVDVVMMPNYSADIEIKPNYEMKLDG